MDLESLRRLAAQQRAREEARRVSERADAQRRQAIEETQRRQAQEEASLRDRAKMYLDRSAFPALLREFETLAEQTGLARSVSITTELSEFYSWNEPPSPSGSATRTRWHIPVTMGPQSAWLIALISDGSTYRSWGNSVRSKTVGIAVEALPSGIIKVHGKKASSLEPGRWERNQQVQQSALDQALNNPFQLVYLTERYYPYDPPDTY